MAKCTGGRLMQKDDPYFKEAKIVLGQRLGRPKPAPSSSAREEASTSQIAETPEKQIPTGPPGGDPNSRLLLDAMDRPQWLDDKEWIAAATRAGNYLPAGLKAAEDRGNVTWARGEWRGQIPLQEQPEYPAFRAHAAKQIAAVKAKQAELIQSGELPDWMKSEHRAKELAKVQTPAP